MPRMRTLKPDFCGSEAIAALSIPCRLHFAMLWTYCDDEGRGQDNPLLIKAALWPLDQAVATEHIEAWQAELAAKGRIVRYEVEGRRYFEVANFTEHQKPQKKQTSKLPAPPPDLVADPSGPPTGPVAYESRSGPVALPPVGEGRGEVGVEVDGEVGGNSSQSDSPPDVDPETPATSGGDRRARGERAIALIGDERFDRAMNAGTVKAAPETYRAECIESARQEFGEKAHSLAHQYPTWSPELIAVEAQKRPTVAEDFAAPSATYGAMETARREREAAYEAEGVADAETVKTAAQRAAENLAAARARAAS